MRPAGIRWIGPGPGDRVLLEALRRDVVRELRTSAALVEDGARPGDLAFDPQRRQHATRPLLHWLEEHRGAAYERVLGVTDVDLFVPILQYTFGEAILSGTVAVVSLARMGGVHGPPLARRIAYGRVVKEGLHELGHTFGLLHCDEPRCLMARAAGVAQVDRKRTHLCAACSERLETLRWESDDLFE